MEIGLIYEHPTWSQHMIDLLRSRGHTVRELGVASHSWDASADPPQCDVWVNRINAMPSDPLTATVTMSSARNLMTWLATHGCNVMNGARAHQLGASKIAQAALFRRAGLVAPATLPIRSPEEAFRAASIVGFPVVTKPNAGGSGRGVQRYDSPGELRAAIDRGSVDLGPDHTAIVQPWIESADGGLYRIEMIDGELLYTTRQDLVDGWFNYCAADGCSTSGTGAIDLCSPAPDVIAGARRVALVAEASMGSVEYIVDATTGSPTFVDFNPFSNLVSGMDAQLGFSPTERMVEAIERHGRRRSVLTPERGTDLGPARN